MCGIIGLLARTDEVRDRLGELLTPMVTCMGTRGPDSAGLAIFHTPLDNGDRRYGFFHADHDFDWPSFHDDFNSQVASPSECRSLKNHAAIVSSASPDDVKDWLKCFQPAVQMLSVGRSIEVYKDEGHPQQIADRYQFTSLSGSHVVGHTRMATESSVSPAHAHPFTAGEDFCLVHNGSLSNPNSIRRKLQRKGIHFETDNDTEAGCRFLEWRMSEGDTLEEAIEASFEVLDGFYTFLMATADRLVLVRDAFACKPAVVAQTGDYVAVASEFRSLAHLPGIESADVFEPMPEQIYSWQQ